MRIVSLLPSLTELVCALGRGDELVGVTHECDFPPGVEFLPHLTRSRIAAEADSAAIDAAGRRAGREPLRPRRRGPRRAPARPDPDAGAVRRLRRERGDGPPGGGRPAGLAARSRASTRPTWPASSRCSAASATCSTPATRPRPWSAGFDDPAESIARRASAAGAARGSRCSNGSTRRSRRATGTRRSSPWPAASRSLARAGERSRRVDLGRGRRGRPRGDPPRPVRLHARPGRGASWPRLRGRPEWRDLAAVRDGRVALVDGSAYFSRPGPRLEESLRSPPPRSTPTPAATSPRRTASASSIPSGPPRVARPRLRDHAGKAPAFPDMVTKTRPRHPGRDRGRCEAPPGMPVACQSLDASTERSAPALRRSDLPEPEPPPMKSETGESQSVWMATADVPAGKPLEGSAEADVCIIGAGIAGLSVAYFLAKAGKKVVVLDDGPIAAGQTRRTTAHLANALDDRYYEIIRERGEEAARLAAESHTAAIEAIETIVGDEAIDCDFARLDGYLFLGARLDREGAGQGAGGRPQGRA